MGKTVEYNGKIYTRNNLKWVDEDSMVVSQNLQSILNKLSFEAIDIMTMSYEEAKQEGDRYKATESYHLAIEYYEQALREADTFSRAAAVLPRMTSCFRKLNQPRKVINLLADMKVLYGERIINVPLLTSVAASYCDLGEPQNAIRCCNWAYKKLRYMTGERCGELSSVYNRACKMIDPSYNKNIYFEERETKKK